jgi:hypothetical protein
VRRSGIGPNIPKFRAGHRQSEIALEALRRLVQEHVDTHEIRTLVVMKGKVGAT